VGFVESKHQVLRPSG